MKRYTTKYIASVGLRTPAQLSALKAEFEAQLVEEEKLNKAIAENLARVKL